MRISRAQQVRWFAVLVVLALTLVGGLPAIAASVGDSGEKPAESVAAAGDADTSPAVEDGKQAEEAAPPPQEDPRPKLQVQVGKFLPAFNSKLRAETRVGESGERRTIDLEDDLGLDDRLDILRIGATYRLSRKGAVDLTYYRFGRNARAVLEEDVEFEDVTFPAGFGIVADTANTFYILRYARLLRETQRSTVYGALGIHFMRFAIDIATTEGTPLADSASVSAPLPTIGFLGTYEFSPQWRLGWRVAGLSLSLGDYSGVWLDAEGSIEYFVREDLALGLGLTAFAVDVDVDAKNLLGSVEYRHTGPVFFVTGRF